MPRTSRKRRPRGYGDGDRGAPAEEGGAVAEAAAAGAGGAAVSSAALSPVGGAGSGDGRPHPPQPVVEHELDSDAEFDYGADCDHRIGPQVAAQIGYPFVPDVRLLPLVPHMLAKTRAGTEFCFAFGFQPSMIDATCCTGSFPMSIDLGVPVFAIKLHTKRCVLAIDDLHISKSVRKAGAKFTFTVNAAFGDVVRMCVKQHGSNWLFPKIRRAFCHMHRHPSKYSTKLVSCEVWQGETLVAGELGYINGRIYTSLTGARTVSKSGSVQLLALGGLLKAAGITVWDFGMAMEYKLALGAKEVPRDDWLALHAKASVDTDGAVYSAYKSLVWGVGRPVTCREAIDGKFGGAM